MSRILSHARVSVLALCVGISMSLPATAQEEGGMDINMDALKQRPAAEDQGQPERQQEEAVPPPPPAPAKTVKEKQPPKAAPQAAKPAKAFSGRSVTVLFEAAQDTLSDSARQRLDQIAASSGDRQRLELMAYAGTEKESASATHRLALKRAIAVRGYLMDKGMDGTRIAVRPQGPAQKDDAPERVDIRFLSE
jgi:outer membrane protein OmpA-like peptidoglycan-associated protein